MYTKITVTLKPNEKEALIALAEQEERDPRGQAAILLRESLRRHGFLPQEQGSSGNHQAGEKKGENG
jgi:hypothetical protein